MLLDDEGELPGLALAARPFGSGVVLKLRFLR